MEWLNYHHLLYFWLVAKEGGVAKAAAKLRLSHPTVSAQVKALEETLGEKLFAKQGRGLVLTEVGKVVYRYADDIFSLGRELIDAVKQRPTGRATRLVVGIDDVVPKLIAKRILDPVWSGPVKVHMVCREDKAERLWAELASHELDVVISDCPLPPGSSVRAYNHLLGECGVSVFGSKALVARYKKGFPGSLDGAPMLLPTSTSALRRNLESYFDARGLRPVVAAEFDDSALLKVFGAEGGGLFTAPTAIEEAVMKQFDVLLLGRLAEVRERFYAVSIERRIRHPAVMAICQAARQEIFTEELPRR